LESILYIILAVIGLSVIIFLHELGHYLMAKWEGMKVETFSIGFGKPIYKWKRKEVQWQIGSLPFGGYVKIAGMDKEGKKEPYEIPGGFYSKKPWARIKVLLAGPFANLLFAFLCFSTIWVCGGREKPFSQVTHIIGWVDPKSELHQKGVGPGDEIIKYNDKPYQGFKDLVYAAVIDGRLTHIEGNRIDYFQEKEIPYDYTLKPYQNPFLGEGLMTIGILSPASYLLYDDFPDGRENPIDPEYPIAKSGIQKGDHIVWVNGELIFSEPQLRRNLNDGKVLITFRREGEVFIGKVPRILIEDLQLTSEMVKELDDWRHEAGLKGKIGSHYFIPYNLTPNMEVEHPIPYVDEESQIHFVHAGNNALQAGDQILAVDGVRVATSYEFLQEIQERKIQIIVERKALPPISSWKKSDLLFIKGTKWDDLLPIIRSIGTAELVQESGDFHLLRPVSPAYRHQFPFPTGKKTRIEEEYQKGIEAIEKIKDPQEKEKALKQFNEYQKGLKLGIFLQDRLVHYNPTPFYLFANIFQDMWRTLVGLIGGYLSPKYLSGPVGIAHVIHASWMVGWKEAFFWLGTISLYLGIFNLFPIPLLDGGHIFFSVIEAIRGKPLKAKTMQKLIFPFVILLILFFLYVTYHDLARIFGRFF
jgi:regulator of sigma E protease